MFRLGAADVLTDSSPIRPSRSPAANSNSTRTTGPRSPEPATDRPERDSDDFTVRLWQRYPVERFARYELSSADLASVSAVTDRA
jgi:hypothetical protein